ncbi:MAG: hypothetical protein HEQ39_12420 [Rhizobacter sp.]
MKTTVLVPNTDLAAALDAIQKELPQVTTALFYLADAIDYLAHEQAAEGQSNPFHLFTHVASMERDRCEVIENQLKVVVAHLTKVGLT